MKSMIIILILVIFFSNFMLSQTVYNISDFNGQTIDLSKSSIPCNAIFSSSNLCFNFQCGVNSSCAGENYTISFYSGNPNKRLALWFDGNNCGNSSQIYQGDHLYVYDGPNTSSTFMHDLIVTNYVQDSIISSGSYITFNWISTTSDSYWWAVIVCETIPSQPTVCVGTNNSPASNFCNISPQICYINGYCGNTSNYYTADLPGNMCEMCNLFEGTIQNNSWISFTADTTFASISVTVSNCTQGLGIQLGVYSGVDCNNFQLISDPDYTSGNGYTNANSTVIVDVPFGNAPALVKGQEYYIMIDGLSGDVCDYSISAVSGVFVISAGQDQSICIGQSAKMNATGGNTYKWSPETGLSKTNIANPLASPTVTTTYTVTVTGGTAQCPQSSVDSVVVFVNPLPVVNLGNDTSFCPGNSITLNPKITPSTDTPVLYTWNDNSGNNFLTADKSGTYSVTITDKDDCTFSGSVQIIVYPLPVLNLGKDTTIKPGTSIVLTQLDFSRKL